MPSKVSISKSLNTFQASAWKAILAKSGMTSAEALDRALVLLGDEVGHGWPRSLSHGGDRRSDEAQGQQWAIDNLKTLLELSKSEVEKRIYAEARERGLHENKFGIGVYTILENA